MRPLNGAVRSALLGALALSLCACSLDFDRFHVAAERPKGMRDDAGGAGKIDRDRDSGAVGSDSGQTGAGGMTAPTDATTDADVDVDAAADAAADSGTTCMSDGDCPSHVCEDSACVQCRANTDCAPADLCAEHRCVPDRKPSRVWLSAGGGMVVGTGYKMRVSIGAPQPMGQATAPGYKLTLGPAVRTR